MLRVRLGRSQPKMTSMSIKSKVSRAGKQVVERHAVERHAISAIRRLQSAIRELIKVTPGETRRPTDLTATLGIHYKLAWQVHRLAHANEPLAQAGNVPGPIAMERFLEATSRRGAPAERVAQVRAVMQEFEGLIDAHAGSRSEFESILSGLSPTGSDQVDLAQKRAAFKAQSHLWGVRAKTRLCTFAYQTSKFEQDLDTVGIRGFVDITRLRKGARWSVSHTRMHQDDPALDRMETPRPIDAGSYDRDCGLSLLKKFCSSPLPRFRSVTTAAGIQNVEMEGEAVGNRSALTFFLGDVFPRAFARYRGDPGLENRTHSMIRTPCEVLVHDVLLHEDTGCRVRPEVRVYGDQRDVDPETLGRECDLLSVRESVLFLGKGLDVLETPDVPRYAEMVQHSFGKLGWDVSKFLVWRCRVEYPIMPSSVVVQFDLPEPAA
jgi:hypothetical protein